MPGTHSPPYGPLPPARCAEGLAGYRRPQLSPALEEREQGQSAVLQRIPGMGPPSWALRGGKSTLRQSALLCCGGTDLTTRTSAGRQHRLSAMVGAP